MKSLRLSLAAVVLVALTACAALGLQPAQSFDQKLGYAYGTYTGLLESAAGAYTAGFITEADRKQVLALSDDARALLDSAHAIEASNATGAAAKLDLASSVLTQLADYLKKRGVKQ